MKFTITKNLGKHCFTFEDEAHTQSDWFRKSQFYTSLPESCGHCGSVDLDPRFRITKEGYKYVDIHCPSCNHQLQFGMSQNFEGEVFKKTWVLYDPNAALPTEDDWIDSQERQRPAQRASPPRGPNPSIPPNRIAGQRPATQTAGRADQRAGV